MKSFLLACVAVLCTCTLSVAQISPSALPDSIEKATADATLQAKNDTVSETSIDNEESTVTDNNFSDWEDHTWRADFLRSPFDGALLVPIVAIFLIFGSPAIILFIIFYFRYKNRQARYRLIQQALDKGQPLPKELFKDGNHSPTPNPQQGIRNTFLGIGLFIFLWAVTDEFGIGTIGLLVACIGIGQWVSDTLQLKRQAKEEEQQLYKKSPETSETEE